MGTALGLPLDVNGKTIQSGSDLHVFTTNITASAWTAVVLPTGVNCKSLLVRTRLGAPCYLATAAAPGEVYLTVTGPLSLDLVKFGGDTLFWVKGTGSQILEVLVSN